MSGTLIRIATRGSRLALWQAHHVSQLLEAKGFKAALTIIKTKGDIVQDRFLHEIGGKGLFVRELETSLATYETDIAVHSLKDLPARTPTPFCLAAILPRHSPRDVFIMHPKFASRVGARGGLISREEISAWGAFTVATASLRRQGLIKHVAPAATLEPVRGNVDTRIEKLNSGNWDGLVLAGASLERLGLKDLPARDLDPEWFVPAPAQGALVIETLETSPHRALVQSLGCQDTTTHVSMEREVLAILGGDCTMPFGCHIFFDTASNTTIGRAVVLNAKGDKAATEHRVPGTWRSSDRKAFIQALVNGLFGDGLEKILKDLRIAIPDLGKL